MNGLMKDQIQAISRSVLWRALAATLLFFLAWGVEPAAAAPAAPQRCDWSDQNYNDFYMPPDLGAIAPERMGELLRVEHVRSYTPEELAAAAGVESSQYGAETYRIMYLSQAPADTPRAVSGMLVVPTGPAPDGGFPVIAHAYGTTGMADKCAPSKRGILSENNLLPWAVGGYVVSATDYAGLGTPGLHPYGVGDAAGFNVLDAARAALDFCDSGHNIATPAANRVFLEGHSQGGQAALFAHELWKTYAPELDVKGTVLFAPGAEPRYLAERMAGPYPTPLVDATVLAMYAYSQYYGTQVNLQTWIREPFASELPDRVENQCAVGLAGWLGPNPDRVFQPSLLEAVREKRWNDLEPWTSYLDLNTPGNFSSSTPILVLQGQSDLIVPAGTGQRLMERLCSFETPASLSYYPNSGHFTVLKDAQAEALQWMGERLAGRAASNSCSQDPGLESHEPVTTTGAAVSGMVGLPVDELFLYAYTGLGWRQIPLQIDEITASGAYTVADNGRLDANDEIVFMAKDLGERAPTNTALHTVLPIQGRWYEIRVVDPEDPARVAWAYLVRSQVLTPTFTDYVDYDSENRRIRSEIYSAGLATSSPWMDYLTLGDRDTNVLDRIKAALNCSVPFLCPINEEQLPAVADGPAKDGPVRVILQDGNVKAYRSKVELSASFSIPVTMTGSVRVSTDFSSTVSGASFYNANVAGEVTVDGIQDAVPATPVSNWWQISTNSGALIHVVDLEAMGGTPSNLYMDDSRRDRTDTGDQRRYGETGVLVENPNRQFDYRFDLFLLPGVQPNAGASYATIFRRTFLVTATPGSSPGGAGSGIEVYLPVVTR